MPDSLLAIGWSDRWAALLAEHGPASEPARVLRHDGVAVQVRTPRGDRSVKLRRGVDAITVGDWLALDGEQVLGLLDHLKLEAPVVGGTSLGANVGLEFAARHPERAGGLFIEMPVLDNALLGAAMIFTPMLLALRIGEPVLRVLAAGARRIPRTVGLVDMGLDWVRQDPAPSRAVLEGILFGRTAPPREERQRLRMPALVIGHPSDPLHPFSDADMVAEEMTGARLVDANSILEWRLNPGRLDDELSDFLKSVHTPAEPARRAAAA